MDKDNQSTPADSGIKSNQSIPAGNKANPNHPMSSKQETEANQSAIINHATKEQIAPISHKDKTSQPTPINRDSKPSQHEDESPSIIKGTIAVTLLLIGLILSIPSMFLIFDPHYDLSMLIALVIGIILLLIASCLIGSMLKTSSRTNKPAKGAQKSYFYLGTGLLIVFVVIPSILIGAWLLINGLCKGIVCIYRFGWPTLCGALLLALGVQIILIFPRYTSGRPVRLKDWIWLPIIAIVAFLLVLLLRL